jgi:predicted acetyltransferase
MSAQPWTVRPVPDEDWEAFRDVDAHAFGVGVPEDMEAQERELHKGGRGIGAYDGGVLAGIATAYSFEVTVPGRSAVPAAGVSWVGVLPTHRRRGVLRALMTHQLHALHDQGDEPLAILWASEPAIYGRFGYGLATRAYSLDVPRSPTALQAGVPDDPGLRLRLVDAADWKAFVPVYDAVAAARPGVVLREEPWWQRAVRDLASLRGAASPKRAVVAEDGDGVRGFALYRTEQHWDERFGKGDVTVQEAMAADPAALAALYRYLFDLDLMGHATVRVAVDDPVLHWLSDPRSAKPSLTDCLYVRLVDLPRALAGRAYAADVDVVIEVRDDLCPWNAGTWRLRATAGGDATCEPADDAPDLSMDVRELGAAYLGGTPVAHLADAGLVVERTPGSVTEMSAALSHHPAPWTSWVF